MKTIANAFACLFLLLTLGFTAFAQQSPGNTDAELAAMQTQVKVLELQKQVEGLQTQLKTLEKQQQSAAPATTTDAQLAATEIKIKILQLQKQISGLQAQQLALLNPPAKTTPAAKPDCVPVAKKNPTAFDKFKKKAQEIADRQIDKTGKRIDKSTGGSGNDNPLPTTAQLEPTTRPSSPCPAGTEPKKQ